MSNDNDYVAACCAVAQQSPKMRVTYGSYKGSRGARTAMVVVMPGGRTAGTEPVRVDITRGGRLGTSELLTIAEALQTAGGAIICVRCLADAYAAFETLLAAAHGEGVVNGLTIGQGAAA